MSNGIDVHPEGAVWQNPIAAHIGPILDPAYLKLIPVDKMRDIVMIQVHAQAAALRAQLQAVEQVAKVVEAAPLK